MPSPMATVPVPVPIVTPAHLFRLEMIDIVLRDNGGFSALAGRRRQTRLRRNRRQRHGLRARDKRGRACSKSKGEF